MNCRKPAHSFTCCLIGALAAVGSWTARPMAHEEHEEHSDDHHGALIQAVRDATDRFRNPALAQAEGYTPLFGCVTGPERGAMGLHFVNFPFVADGRLDVTHPELVIYEPLPSGNLKLTGVEFLVFKDQWDATHTNPPQLMGQLFHLNEAPNRYRLPAFYSLHVWAWKENPFGAYVDWHPNVSCEWFTQDDAVLPPDPGKDG